MTFGEFGIGLDRFEGIFNDGGVDTIKIFFPRPFLRLLVIQTDVCLAKSVAFMESFYRRLDLSQRQSGPSPGPAVFEISSRLPSREEGMIDHLILKVKNLAKSRQFYEQALAPLNLVLVMEFPGGLALGREKPELGLTESHFPHTAVHLAFTSPDRFSVDAFYEAALAAGARDNGAPGLRPEYHLDYYGAFVLDPDGNNIEAVCHRPG